MSPLTSRRRLSSTGDSSAPPSESSEGSEAGGDHSSSHGGMWLHGGFDSGHLTPTDGAAVQDHERQQIESFFSALGTQIYVCASLANLYDNNEGDWTLRFTGIPVLLHDTGTARSRTKPRIQILLAERGSCFTLWRDTIDHLSDYRIAGASFHTMCLSTDHRIMIGFSFDTTQAAKETWTKIERLVSDPENICLSVPGRKKKKSKPQPDLRPPKSQISIPCQFQHVINVNVGDKERYFSLQAFVDSPREQQTPTTLG